jgi:plasmid stability protein
MKNITVSLDDETYRQARIVAAEQNTSVSALVRRFLSKLAIPAMTSEERQAELERFFAALDAKRTSTSEPRRATFTPPPVRKPDVRSARLLKTLAKGRNVKPVGRLRREELYDRSVLR